MFFRPVSRQPSSEEFWKTGIYNNLKTLGLYSGVFYFLLTFIKKAGFIVGKLGLKSI